MSDFLASVMLYIIQGVIWFFMLATPVFIIWLFTYATSIRGILELFPFMLFWGLLVWGYQKAFKD